MSIQRFLEGQCEIMTEVHSCLGHHPCAKNHVENGGDKDEIHLQDEFISSIMSPKKGKRVCKTQHITWYAGGLVAQSCPARGNPYLGL